ncbi:hypothetical protein BGZ70_006421 [Mortierella alpina]|uniref:Uncharacterized protein n=1 Tax=Mortierella alpina TaxID=64518 RepID=A0A9P6M3V9_MORAP|nr:hypothetical protein BGZ70_006421 [Mortierella alpina]
MPSSNMPTAMTSLTPSVLEVNIRRLMAKCDAKAHGAEGILQGPDRTKYLANIKALKEMMVVLEEDLSKRPVATSERSQDGTTHNTQPLTNNGLRISSSQDSTRDQAQIEAALQNDRAQREEMEAGLSMLMQQLRHNAMAIHQTLADEKSSGLLDDADQALDSNITRLGKERTRLELYSKQSRKTKWIIWGIVLVVSLVFVFMFFIIRIF